MQPELKKPILEYVLGSRRELEIVGPPIVVATIYEAAESSMRLLQALREERDAQTVRSLMERRKSAAARFKRVTGEDWDI
jgi:hypothetical protein